MTLITRKTLAMRTRQRELEMQVLRRFSEEKNRHDQDQMKSSVLEREPEVTNRAN